MYTVYNQCCSFCITFDIQRVNMFVLNHSLCCIAHWSTWRKKKSARGNNRLHLHGHSVGKVSPRREERWIEFAAFAYIMPNASRLVAVTFSLFKYGTYSIIIRLNYSSMAYTVIKLSSELKPKWTKLLSTCLAIKLCFSRCSTVR